jgi:hypothetical protein
MPSHRQRLSPEQRQRRMQALDSAYASLRIEGMEPTAEGLRLHQRWADGLASADEIVAQLIALHVPGNA